PFSHQTTPLSVISSTSTSLPAPLQAWCRISSQCLVSFADAVSALIACVSCTNCRSLVQDNCRCSPSGCPGQTDRTPTSSRPNPRVLLGLSSRDIL
ncbi:hypothetical protein V2W45_1196621, partial [Cenococcum geophilum]